MESTTQHPAFSADFLADALIMLDPDGYIQSVNKATVPLTGYIPAELVGRHIGLLYGNETETVQPDYELLMARKQGSQRWEGWRYRKDGTRFWGDLTYSWVAKPEAEGFYCLLRDTSERKETELGLRHSEERYRLMVEGVRDYAIFMLDATGHILTWNEGARRLKGYLPNEIIGRHFSTFYTLPDLQSEKPRRELEIATATGKYEEEGWRVKKDGSMFWANVVITALHNDQNILIGFSKVTRDLTERRQNEEFLRQSEERYRLLVQQVTDYGIFMMDDKGRIVSWNEGAERINGYTAQEIIGRSFAIFYPEEDILNGKPTHELKVARAKGKYEEEGWRLRKDGSRFWANVVITAVYNIENALIGYSKVTRDLTERKEAERELRESYDRYRRLAEELQLTNRELTYANKELEQFTSIVSHDLQEPIRTVRSFLQLIDIKLRQAQYDDLQIYIGKSIQAGNRMRELIQNLLHYTQLGKYELVATDTSISELFSKAQQNLRTAIEASRAEIVIECDVATVHGDPVQLLQVVQNLISNALKFTEGERPHITLRCARKSDEVQFEVADQGIGIDRDDLHKVFEIFRRLDTRQEYPGTGIGLAICKKIVDRHGGRIWLESEPGRGTTFYFTIKDASPNIQPGI